MIIDNESRAALPFVGLTEEEKEYYANRTEKGILLKIAHSFNTDVEREELISSGRVGLNEALETYNKNNKSGATFVTYASVCITNAILHTLRIHTQKHSKNISLQAPIYDDMEEYCLEDILGTEEDIYSQAEHNYRVKSLISAIDSLNPTQAYILKASYGIDGYQEMTQVQIATELNTTQANVSKMQKKAESRLREIMVNTYHIYRAT